MWNWAVATVSMKGDLDNKTVWTAKTEGSCLGMQLFWRADGGIPKRT